MEIICAEDCGNAPKKLLLRDLTISFAKGDIDDCLEWMTAEIIWYHVGRKTTNGKENVAKWWKSSLEIKIKKLIIENIITHGNVASVNGEIVRENERVIHYCSVYHFNGFGKKAKIKEITSYLIEEVK